jgi:general nucleoside transport system permease protein
MDQTLIIGLLAATLRIATPILLAGLGEVFAERAGVLNLGIEGIMLMGAIIGFIAAYLTGSLWVGLIVAILVGMVAGLLMGWLAVTLGLNQHVSGLGVTLLASGIALFFFRVIFKGTANPPQIEPFQQASFPFLGVLAPIFEQYWLTYFAFLLVPIAWYILYRTTFGLWIRSVGENPEAADTAGVNVARVRYSALIISGALMGLGGAFLSLAQLGTATFGIVAGRGWVAIAIVIFGNWQPEKVLIGALLFGFVEALQLRLRAIGVQVPYQLLLALPYLATIVALALAGRNASYPSALLKPYKREG